MNKAGSCIVNSVILLASAGSSGAGTGRSASAASSWSRLAEAREQALANRYLARAGGDPVAEKRRSLGVPTFAEAAGRVIEQKRAGWRSPRS